MLTFITFCIHTLLSFVLGYNLLLLKHKSSIETPNIFLALLLGIFAETTLSFFVLWLGGSIGISLIAVFLILLILSFFNRKVISTLFKDRNAIFKQLKPSSFKWYEWILVLFIVEKVAMILWQLFSVPTYFSDALKHWSTCGKAIYTGANFSMSQVTGNFLGSNLSLVWDYPLQLPIYRALQATLNGEWNEFLSRSDGFLFFIIICGIVGSIFHQIIGKRWVTLGAVFIVASLPLQVWHAASGYADIAVEAYLVAAIACFIRKEWWLCGIFMAGTIWSKNDGLAMYLPGILVAGGIYQVFLKDVSWGAKGKNIGQFVLGLSLVFPWLAFQTIYTHSIFDKILEPIKNLLSYKQGYDANDYQVVLAQVGEQFVDATPTYELFWDKVFLGSTHGIFWLAIFLGLILMSKKLLLDHLGRSLMLFFVITCALIYYVFTYTPAYEYLVSETTIHRVLLQFSAATLLIVGYGMSLHWKKETKKSS